MHTRIATLVVLTLAVTAVTSPLTAGEANVEIPQQYRVEPPRFPEEDLSGALGLRFLELLSNQVERNLEVMENDRKKAGIESATSGNVTLFDDPRWVYQKSPRKFYGEEGSVKPETGALHQGSWINVDDRLGYAVLGSD
ncbi:MAG: hypothetical protein ABIP48_03375, partial [Planctomycetota bacterium]